MEKWLIEASSSEENAAAARKIISFKLIAYVPPMQICVGKFIRSVRNAVSEPRFVNEHPRLRPSTGGV